MARYRATIESERPCAEVFAYLSDFSTTREWDPGVVEAERIGSEPVGEGTEFRLIAAFLGRRSELTYRIVEYNAPHAVTLVGENAAVISRDRITCEDIGGKTRITYDAELSLKRSLKLADPLLSLVFRRVGERARAGLIETLGATGHE